MLEKTAQNTPEIQCGINGLSLDSPLSFCANSVELYNRKTAGFQGFSSAQLSRAAPRFLFSLLPSASTDPRAPQFCGFSHERGRRSSGGQEVEIQPRPPGSQSGRSQCFFTHYSLHLNIRLYPTGCPVTAYSFHADSNASITPLQAFVYSKYCSITSCAAMIGKS